MPLITNHYCLRPRRANSALILGLVLFAVGLGCSGESDSNKTLTELRVGVLPDQTEAQLRATYNDLVEYLGESIGVPARLVIPTSYAHLLQIFHAGEIDLANFGGVTFVRANEGDGATALVLRNVDLGFQSYVLVRGDSDAMSLADLEGSAFCFGSQLSTSGHYMPRYFLQSRGIVPETFFRSVYYSGAQDATAYAVRDGKAAAKYRDKDFDITFLDIELPNMNGVDCFEKLRDLKGDAKVIMMTGYGGGGMLDRALERGALEGLHKLFDIDRMLDLVDRMRSQRVTVLVDDDRDFSAGMREYISSHGFLIETYCESRRGLDRIRAGDVGMVVLDLRMPLPYGFEVFSEARNGDPDLPVVVITGFSEEEAETLAAMKTLSLSRVLIKPFAPLQLLQTMNELIP